MRRDITSVKYLGLSVHVNTMLIHRKSVKGQTQFVELEFVETRGHQFFTIARVQVPESNWQKYS